MPKITESQQFQKYRKIIKVLIVIMNLDHFSKEYEIQIYFRIDQNQFLQDLQTKISS